LSQSRVPPNNTDAEKSLLGAILIDKDSLLTVASKVKPDFFYDEINALVYKSIIQLFDERESIDIVTLTAKLKKNGDYKKVGGKEYLTELANYVPTSAHVENYAKIIEENYIKRELIHFSGELTEIAFSEKTDSAELLEQAEKKIFKISQGQTRTGFIALRDALAESFDRLDELSKNADGLRGVSTGFVDIDNKLAGLQKSNLIILAARPGTGKTALVLNIAQKAAINSRSAVGIFSLEMSKEELVDRLLVSQSEIDAWKLKTGKLSEDDSEKLTNAMGELAEAPIFIDDTPGMSIMEMRTKSRRLQMEQNVKLIIVDYLQLMHGTNTESRVQEVSEISQSLKNLARELKIPILAVSQLSRAVESRSTKVPQLADLRESGAIEQDADVVMFLYRQDDVVDKFNQYVVKLLIAKHRNGPTGQIDLLFRGDKIKFYNVDNKRS
jgi:replicative DNA helicase